VVPHGRPKALLLGLTMLLGVLGAVGVLAGGRPADETFVLVSKSAQSLMSVTLPFVTVLMARDGVRLVVLWKAATALAVAVAASGIVISAVALLLASGGDPADRWDHATAVVVFSVLVQIVCALVGTGFGLLLRSVVLACASTVVVPIGLWIALGSAPALRPVRAWTTPYATVQTLFSGHATVLAWAQWLVVFLLWGVALNAAGAARVTRRKPVP
jgi:hypothetical protein